MEQNVLAQEFQYISMQLCGHCKSSESCALTVCPSVHAKQALNFLVPVCKNMLVYYDVCKQCNFLPINDGHSLQMLKSENHIYRKSINR